MVSVHYILDKELVESGQIQIIFNAAVVRAEDYQLAQTQLRDALAPDVPLESLTVYVLILPGRSPEVFKRFDSKPMEEAIGNLPRGSVLHYDGNALMAKPPEAQMQALMAYCKEKGISFIESPTR